MRRVDGTTSQRYCSVIPHPDVKDSLPRSFGAYILHARLGEGTTGVVYKASQGTHRHVALKIYKREDSSDDAIKRHTRGTQLAAQLDHPHIVHILDYGEAEGTFFVASELLEGSDLKAVLPGSTRIPMHLKCRWMLQLCSALAYAHEKGVIHRDIKPANVFVRDSDDVVLTDFGIARKSDSDITRSGTIVGTPDYYSPEQILMVRPDPRSDIFSLGIVFYELWTGIHPFRAENRQTTVHRMLNETPAPAHEANATVPLELTPVLAKLLHKDARLRYSNCNEIIQDLEKFGKKTDSHWKVVSKRYGLTKTGDRLKIWILILILLCLGIVLLLTM